MDSFVEQWRHLAHVGDGEKGVEKFALVPMNFSYSPGSNEELEC